MPGFDRTGPMGMGPMTGGGFGLCRQGRARTAAGRMGYAQAYALRGAGRGFAPWGGGRGRVWGGGRGGAFRGAGRGGYGYWGFAAGPGVRGVDPRPWRFPSAYGGWAAGEELEYLRGVLAELEEDLEAVRGRISDLEAKHER